MEFSLLFTTPVATSGEPHRIALRREALLVYGKPQVRLSGKEDVIEVRAPGSDAEGRALGLEDGMVLVVRRFASQGQVVCDHMVGGRSRVVLAAIRGGCTFIGADEDQWRIYRVLEQLAGTVTESPPPDQERPERWCSFHPTAGDTRHPVPSVPRRGIRRVSAAPVVGLPPPLPTRRAWGRPRTAGGPPTRGRAVNQRRRSGTCRYRTPHTRPEARGGRFSSSRARRPETESSPGTSGSRFRQRPKGWTWSVAPQAGANPIMASSLAAFPNVMSFNCSTQGSGRPAGRRHPRAIAGSVSLWCGDNPTLVVHALAVSQFVPTGWLVLEVWPESHWPGFALRQAGVFQSYTAFNTCRVPTVTSTIDVKKTTAWGESGFPPDFEGLISSSISRGDLIRRKQTEPHGLQPTLQEVRIPGRQWR